MASPDWGWYAEGFLAYNEKKKPFTECKYGLDTREYAYWMKGYSDAIIKGLENNKYLPQVDKEYANFFISGENNEETTKEKDSSGND